MTIPTYSQYNSTVEARGRFAGVADGKRHTAGRGSRVLPKRNPAMPIVRCKEDTYTK